MVGRLVDLALYHNRVKRIPRPWNFAPLAGLSSDAVGNYAPLHGHHRRAGAR